MSRITRLLWMHSPNNAGNNAGNILRNNMAMFTHHTGRLSMNAANGGLFHCGGCSLTC